MRIFFYAIAFSAILYTTVTSVPIKDDDDDDGSILADEDQKDEDMLGDSDTNYYDDNVDQPPKVPEGSTEKNNQFEPRAEISTPSEVFVKDLGETVVLPCQTTTNDLGVIIWYKNDAILFQGDITMGGKKNHKLLPDNSLKISEITTDDDGQYKCVYAISQKNEAAITHSLKVKTSPSIVVLRAKDDQTVLSVGQELVLTCHAQGYPEPVISWHKETMKEGRPVNERLELTGNTFTIPNISRKDEGRYLCFADNKIGNPATSYINIELTHPPIVNIEKYIVNSDTDMDTELKCTVKSKPVANVIWLRNGNNLKSTEHIHLMNEGNDHILILKGLKETDFGKYVCLAKNYLGTVEKTINLVKTPAVLQFIKPEKPTRDLVLTWKIESKTPITGHELQYRKKGGSDSEWQTVYPTVHEGEDGVYVIKHTLTGLEEGTYETRCRSQNRHGWSDYSEITLVGGERAHHGKHGNKKHHKNHNKEKPFVPTLQDVELAQQPDTESKLGESKNSSNHPLTGSTFTVILSCIVSFMYIFLHKNRL